MIDIRCLVVRWCRCRMASNDNQLVSTRICDNDSAGSLAVALAVFSTAAVVSSGLIAPNPRFTCWPVVTYLLNSTKLHS